MNASRLIALMFIIGFVCFIGSILTGSYALAGATGGFFAGATCAMAMGLVVKEDEEPQEGEEQTDTPSDDEQEEQEETPEPRPMVGRSKYGGAL